jgi:hypothetical protein
MMRVDHTHEPEKDYGSAHSNLRRSEAVSCLPEHGRVSCTLCFPNQSVLFDQTKRTEANWRITNNPLAWGSTTPEVVVLGFSKGPTQAGALASAPHDEIAYKKSRGNVGKILAHIGLLPPAPPNQLKRDVDRMIADRSGRLHFGSFIRCTVERFDEKSFVASSFGRGVAARCATRFLGSLPPSTKLIVMFGLGTNLNYVDAALQVFKVARPGSWRKLNDVSYADEAVTVVHVEHFASQGSLIPDWLGITNKPRARLGKLAQQSVRTALSPGKRLHE